MRQRHAALAADGERDGLAPFFLLERQFRFPHGDGDFLDAIGNQRVLAIPVVLGILRVIAGDFKPPPGQPRRGEHAPKRPAHQLRAGAAARAFARPRDGCVHRLPPGPSPVHVMDACIVKTSSSIVSDGSLRLDSM